MKAGSLASRLAVLQQAMTLAVVVAFAGSSLWLTAGVLRRAQQDFLVRTAERVARDYDDEIAEGPDPHRAAAEVIEQEAAPGVTIEMTDASGHSLARARSSARTRADDRSSLLQARARGASGVAVRVAMSDELHQTGIAALARSLVIAAVPLLLVGLLLGRLIVRRALRPLSTMADRAAHLPIEQGVRSLGDPTGLEEIDRLSLAFGRVLERLDDALLAERRFTADVSHELRTPLTVLSGELEIAGARAGFDPVLAAGLATASEQVRAMRELVEAILLLHRSSAVHRDGGGEFELVNLADVAREVTAEAGVRWRGRATDITLEAPDEVLVLGHPTLLASAFRNLMDNALKFTRAGDRVRIRVSDGPPPTAVLEDGGPGVPVPERERVFDPFFRGAEARAGSGGFGLGLPILRRVARAHGGDVSIGDSDLGGARFVLTLPALDRTS